MIYTKMHQKLRQDVEAYVQEAQTELNAALLLLEYGLPYTAPKFGRAKAEVEAGLLAASEKLEAAQAILSAWGYIRETICPEEVNLLIRNADNERG